MESEKTLSLPSASWTTRKADGIVQSKYEDLKTKEWMALSLIWIKKPRTKSTDVQKQEK